MDLIEARTQGVKLHHMLICLCLHLDCLVEAYSTTHCQVILQRLFANHSAATLKSRGPGSNMSKHALHGAAMYYPFLGLYRPLVEGGWKMKMTGAMPLTEASISSGRLQATEAWTPVLVAPLPSSASAYQL
jgi:hypothetical protein